MHLGTEYFNLISEQCEIRGNKYSRSIAYLRALNEILNPFYTFFFQFGYSSVQKILETFVTNCDYRKIGGQSVTLYLGE